MVALGIEVGGRWGNEASNFTRLLVKADARSSPPSPQAATSAALASGWSTLLTHAQVLPLLPACCSKSFLRQDVEQETQGAFQDAHNQGYDINEYTTKVHALGDKLMQGLKRIAQKIHAEETDGNADKLTTRQRNKEKVKKKQC